jgi:hypothetical protein
MENLAPTGIRTSNRVRKSLYPLSCPGQCSMYSVQEGYIVKYITLLINSSYFDINKFQIMQQNCDTFQGNGYFSRHTLTVCCVIPSTDISSANTATVRIIIFYYQTILLYFETGYRRQATRVYCSFTLSARKCKTARGNTLGRTWIQTKQPFRVIFLLVFFCKFNRTNLLAFMKLCNKSITRV